MLQFFYRQWLFAAVCAHLCGVDGRFFMLPMRLQRLCAFVASNRADHLFHRERKGLRSREDVLFIVMKRVYAHDEKASRCVFANKKQGWRR